MRGLLFAGGGPDILVGRTTTRGSQQSALSKRLSPPSKWSYMKLVMWSGVATLIALVMYVQHVMSSPAPASSLPAKLYVVFAPLVLLLLVGIVWRHNHSTFQQEYALWKRLVSCEQCGTVSQQSLRLKPSVADGSARWSPRAEGPYDRRGGTTATIVRQEDQARKMPQSSKRDVVVPGGACPIASSTSTKN